MNQMIESVQPVLMSSDVRAGVEIHLQWQSKDQFSHSLDRPTYRFLVRDVDALYVDFQSRGVITEKATGQGPWRAPWSTPWGSREFHLHDPDGNGLHFYRSLGA